MSRKARVRCAPMHKRRIGGSIDDGGDLSWFCNPSLTGPSASAAADVVVVVVGGGNDGSILFLLWPPV